MSDKGRDQYPEFQPYDSGFLKVSELHTLYYEQSGKPDGSPALFLHGGPGAGCIFEKERRWFDPDHYRIILFDQRGAGKSTPSAELQENTTWELVSDIEKLREHLGIKSWLVMGCSWGTTLAMTYAISHPDRVKALVVQGIFFCTRREVQWFYQDGCSLLWPELFEDFVSLIPQDERSDMLAAYYKRLTSTDRETQLTAAKSWSRWELSTLRPQVDPEYVQYADDGEFCLRFARIESHYFTNGAFFDSENFILDNIHKIKHIPTTIINGRFDVITPIETAWKLHKALPQSDFVIAPVDGHSDKDQGIRTALLEATDKYRKL